MLTEFIANNMARAQYKLLEDGAYFGEIPGLQGVWAQGKTLETCRQELQSALEDWVIFSLKMGASVPGLPVKVPPKKLQASA